jgi:hypothetical protein
VGKPLSASSLDKTPVQGKIAITDVKLGWGGGGKLSIGNVLDAVMPWHAASHLERPVANRPDETSKEREVGD